MSLTVLSVAYPFAPVGSRALGGAEQVLTSVEEALVARGYRSLVVACAGSSARGQLFPTHVPEGVLTPAVQDEVTAAHQVNIDKALQSADVDLIHMHGIDFCRYRLPRELRALVTLHLPPSWYPGSIWSLPGNYRLQCVSESQRRACPPSAQSRLSVVENGVPLHSAPAEKGDYALMLSRICPEKNLQVGLDAARLAGIPAVLAGDAFPYPDHLRYMEEEIRPRLRGAVKFVGPVSGDETLKLLARARCLLLPTLAPETSSLSAMEALAAGTPVVAYRSGAIPEIVEEARTGFLVETVKQMAAAIGKVNTLDPEACREAARQRFSIDRMINGYLALYRSMRSTVQMA